MSQPIQTYWQLSVLGSNEIYRILSLKLTFLLPESSYFHLMILLFVLLKVLPWLVVVIEVYNSRTWEGEAENQELKIIFGYIAISRLALATETYPQKYCSESYPHQIFDDPRKPRRLK